MYFVFFEQCSTIKELANRKTRQNRRLLRSGRLSNPLTSVQTDDLTALFSLYLD